MSRINNEPVTKTLPDPMEYCHLNWDKKVVKLDRMRNTKDSLSANLILFAIVLDALYFVSLYQSDVQSYYYTWKIGASIIYNLLFMLIAFLCSENVKGRKSTYTGLIIFLGIMQFVRIFDIPMKAHEATMEGEDLLINFNLQIDGVVKEVAYVTKEQIPVMDDKQFIYMVSCLIISGVCLLVAAVNSYKNNKELAEYSKFVEELTD